jgi:hypothetical protein
VAGGSRGAPPGRPRQGVGGPGRTSHAIDGRGAFPYPAGERVVRLTELAAVTINLAILTKIVMHNEGG